MWRRHSDALRVGVAPYAVWWQLPSGEPQSVATSNLADVAAQAAVAIRSSPGSQRAARCDVVVGSGLARHWVQEVPRGLRSFAELRMLVQSRAEQLFGSEPGWTVAADWRSAGPFLCAAVPRTLTDAASAASAQQRSKLVLTTSLVRAMCVLRPSTPSNGWSALLEADHLHLLHLQNGDTARMRSVTVPASVRAEQAEAFAADEVARTAGLFGGLPAGPVHFYALGQDSSASQAQIALALASTAEPST